MFNPNEPAVMFGSVYYGISTAKYTTGNYWLSMKRKQGVDIPSGSFGVVFKRKSWSSNEARWFVLGGTEESSYMTHGTRLNFISADDVNFIGLAVHPARADIWNAFLNAYDIQIEEGNVATPFVPYGNVYIPQNQTAQNQ